MTPGEDGPSSEQRVSVWENLPLTDQAGQVVRHGERPGSTPVGADVGQHWEAYSPPMAAGSGDVVAEPPLACAPELVRRPTAASGKIALAVALVMGVGGVAFFGSLSLQSTVAPVADIPGIAAPDPVVPLPDPGVGRLSGTALPGVVAVYGQLFSTSGLVMDTDGMVVVPYHPLATALSARINVLAPGGETMDATMVGFDAAKDIAVLSVPGLRKAEVPTVAGEPVGVGDQVEVSSYSVGRFGAGVDYASTVATQIVDTRARTAVELVWTEFFAEVSGLLKLRLDPAGDGGVGQVVFASGDVIGLVIDQDGSSGYAVPIADLAEIVSIVQAGEGSGSVRVGPPGSLGLSFGANSIDSEGRPYVATVEPFGPAAAAGIKEGDLLIKVGARRLNTLGQRSISPAAALRMLEPESPVAVTWISGASGKQQTATVVPTTATGY
ncbi:MAG: PDZ domain-containing protein [Propionicimonas sp.]